MKAVNSPRAKILYDIYHAQVMDGNIVATIRENIQWIGHFITHEWTPTMGKDPVASLNKVIGILDV
jgi:sugar phosphate isomerase/epimerase